MNLIYRTFREGDQKGILKTYSAAFCNSRICQPSTPEFWDWKYGPNRPNYDPKGYQICEYKNRIVGSIMTTIRTMKFKGEIYKIAGIDDVATCPILERRGIGKRLMQNALKFIEDTEVDLTILSADPGGHAKKIYWRSGYQYTTFFSIALKVISFRNVLNSFPPITPLAPLLRLYGELKSRRSIRKYEGNLQFEILGKNQTHFRRKLNENYRSLYSFAAFNQDYWNWYHVERPRAYESIVIAAKEGNRIVAGGVITRSFLMVFNSVKWVPLFILTELFVDKQYRGQGLGCYMLYQLERVARLRGVGAILLHFHGNHGIFSTLMKKMGYIYVNRTTLQMIKPISERAKAHFQENKEKKYVWKVPLEQLGY